MHLWWFGSISMIDFSTVILLAKRGIFNLIYESFSSKFRGFYSIRLVIFRSTWSDILVSFRILNRLF